MSLYIDALFMDRISHKFEHLKKKSNNLWNFRCPLCGDSQKTKHKARGYVYQAKDALVFHCHNCGASLMFGNLLKQIDRNLYNEYLLETFRKPSPKSDKTVSFDEFKTEVVFEKKIELPTIESLADTHFAKQFCLKRQIPQKYFSTLFFAENFKLFINDLMPNQHEDMKLTDARLIIPFYSEKNILLGLSARALSKVEPRYIVLKLQHEAKKIYGLNTVDKTKTIYVVEGPIDSFFIDNAIATMDSALYRVVSTIGYSFDYVFVYDNEPKNKEVVKNMLKTVKMGHRIFVWPAEFSGIKDVNDAVLAGYSGMQVIIDKNTYSGLKAELEISKWKA